MEPWQDTPPAPGAEHLCTRFVCRVSGAPSDSVDELRAPRTLDVLSRLDALDQKIGERRERVSALLFGAIGAAQEKPLRNKLITLKRELYNLHLRPLTPEKLGQGLALLSGEAADEARALAAEAAERRGLEEELRQTYGEETAALRARFRELLGDADFRKGLMISSRALHGALERYSAAGGELSGKEEKTERGLLRYYTRMAMKATPFATFCAIIPGTFVDESAFGADEGIFRFQGDPRTKRSFVRVNKTLYGILLDHLKERPTVRRALEVELNPTLRGEGSRLVYLTALQGREVFQRLNHNEVLDLIVKRFRERTAPTLGDLIAALSADEQIEATPEEAEAYLDKLIEIGFLRFHTGIREQDADWDIPFRELLGRMEDEQAHRSAELLRRIREMSDAYGGAGVEERARLIEEMNASINAAFEEMEVKGRLRRDMPFYEDATAGASAEVPLTAGVRRAFDAWTRWARATVRLAWPRGEQATMRHFFDTFYTDTPRVPLLQFYEDFYREHFKAHVEKEAKIRAGAKDDDLKGYNVGNPYELEFVTRMSEARNRMTELFTARWREAGEDAEEITVTPEEVEEALRGVETTSTVCRSMGSFACLVPPSEPGGDARLLLQGSSYTAGYGKYFSRFLYMLPDDMQEHVRRDNGTLTEDLLAEICGDAQFNANLHPPLLKWEISYPTGESGNAEEQLKSSALFVEADPEDAHSLILRHGPSGKRVVPVDLGFLNPRMRPPLYQLLSRFTPAVTFGPGLPESPVSPKKPEQPGAARADAPVADEPAAEAAAALEGEAQAAADAAPEAASAPEQAPAPEPKIQVRPRITFDGGALVLARRRWIVPKALFPQREEHEGAAEFFARVHRWRTEAGLPETAYLRINPLPEPSAAKPGEEPQAEAPPPEPEIPGYEQPAEAAHEEEAPEAEAPAGGEAGDAAEGEGEGAKTPAAPRTQASRDLFKPQFIDFADPLLVGLLGKMAVNLKNFSVTIEERLPAREHLPRHAGERYATEVVVQLYFPTGTIETAHAAEEDHAAVA